MTDLIERNVLYRYERLTNYKERRDDGYEEPEEIYLVGTAHISDKSVEDVQRVIRTLKPDSVIV